MARIDIGESGCHVVATAYLLFQIEESGVVPVRMHGGTPVSGKSLLQKGFFLVCAHLN